MTFFYRQSKFQNHYYKLLLLNFFKIHGEMTIFMPIENLKSLLQSIIDTNSILIFFIYMALVFRQTRVTPILKVEHNPIYMKITCSQKKISINQTYKRYKH
jgi:hypothetical protein